MWTLGNVVYYDTNSRVHAVPGHYEEFYNIGGLMIPSEFLSQVRKTDIVRQAESCDKEVLIIHGGLDKKAPICAVEPYLGLYREKVHLEIIGGAGHQFTPVEWKNRVYELSINYIKGKASPTKKYLLGGWVRS